MSTPGTKFIPHRGTLFQNGCAQGLLPRRLAQTARVTERCASPRGLWFFFFTLGSNFARRITEPQFPHLQQPEA